MIRGFYIATTGMIHQRQRLDTVSNNVANLNTTGFRMDRVVTRSFDDELLLRMQPAMLNPRSMIGILRHGVYSEEVVTSFEQGSLQSTGRNSDLALQGAGFFVVMSELGERYTRDGSFTVDATGTLTTAEGLQLQGERGAIVVGDGEFFVDAQGAVFSGGEFIDRLRVVDFPDLTALRKAGDNLFENPDAANAPVDSAVMVRQGFLEGSNVDVAREVTNMMEIFRRYESSQQILRMMDETLGRTVNDLGRI